MTLSIKNKIVIFVIFLILSIVCLVGFYFSSHIKPLLIKRELSFLEQELEQIKPVFESKIQVFKDELLTLSSHTKLAQLIELKQRIVPRRFSDELVIILDDFLKTNEHYHSIRYIDISGSENRQLVNVAYYDGNGIRVNKNSSKFIQDILINDILDLKDNDTYISPIFLNNSKQPIIQLAILLTNQKNQPTGIIISDINAQIFLDNTREVDSSFYNINDKGEYLIAPENKLLNLGQTFQQQYPETNFLFTKTADILSSQLVLYPRQSQSPYFVISKVSYGAPTSRSFIVFAFSITRSELVEKSERYFSKIIYIFIAIIVGLILLSYLFILKIISPLEELVLASSSLGTDYSKINFPTDSDGELAKLAKSLEDMNKTIIEKNESLKNSELMSRSVMNNMSDSLITLRSNGSIYSLNSAAEALFSCTLNDVQHQPISLLIPDLKKVIIQSNVEQDGLNTNQQNFPLEVSITQMELQFRKSDAKKYFIVLCRDIKERKKAENQLKQAGIIAVRAKEEAEKASIAKTKFLSYMGHELRTPLNSILGFSQMLLVDKDDLSEDFSYSVQNIYNSGKHLLKMVSDVLDISSIELEEMAFSFKRIKVLTFIEALYTDAAILGQKENTHIELLLPDASQLNLIINVDDQRLRQVLLNIIRNAIYFNRDSHKVILSFRKINEKNIAILVKDEGVGISKKDLEIIFNPFERLNAYERGIDGLGIGLTIAKQITEKMNGVIRVESQPNIGSQFYIIFPFTLER